MVGDQSFDDFGDPSGNVPCEMDYALALERVLGKLTKLQRGLLEALVDAPDEGLSGKQIATLLGLEHHAGVNRAIVSLAMRLTKAVGVEPPKRQATTTRGVERWWHVVALGRTAPGNRFIWKLRPALRDAARAAGLGGEAERVFAEEREEGTLREGALRLVRVNAYERNALARRRCIEHHGTACAVCGLTLGSVYGALAEGLIHVHHLRPLSERGGVDYELDPIADLRPVCPNCHVVLHRRTPLLTIEELRALVLGRK